MKNGWLQQAIKEDNDCRFFFGKKREALGFDFVWPLWRGERRKKKLAFLCLVAQVEGKESFRKFWFELVSEGDLAFGRTQELYLFCFSSLFFFCGLIPFLSRLMKYVCNEILYIPLSMKICSKEMITFSLFTFS